MKREDIHHIHVWMKGNIDMRMMAGSIFFFEKNKNYNFSAMFNV